MTLRFPTNLAHLLLGGALLVFCFAFSAGPLAWLALAAGCIAVVVSMAGFAVSARGGAQRGLDLVMALTGAWLIVASRVFAPAAVKWNAVGSAGLVAALALLGLVLHERSARPALAALREPQRPAPTSIESRWRAREGGVEPPPVTIGATNGR